MAKKKSKTGNPASPKRALPSQSSPGAHVVPPVSSGPGPHAAQGPAGRGGKAKGEKPEAIKPHHASSSGVVKPAPVPLIVIPPQQIEALPSTGPGRASTAGPKSGVVVVGSLNMDLVVRTEVMPEPGQTVMGQDLVQNPGGKGANQATAVGRLWQKRTPGAKLIGRIGDDLFGQNVLRALNKSKVETGSVLTTRHTPTGTAMIIVDRHGENAIVVAGGANRHLAATDMLSQRKTIESSVVLVAQLEVPYDTVACAFALAKRSNVLTILDTAPASAEGLPESLYHVDILTPNQSEAQQLTGITVRNVEDARRAAERFLLRGTRIVVIKMGSQGAVIVQRESTAAAVAMGEPGVRGPSGTLGISTSGTIIAQHIPGFRVQVVDATAAGDAFTGALAVGLAEGMPLAQAVRFANAAGALACMKLGAMASIPGRAEVELLLNPPPPVAK